MTTVAEHLEEMLAAAGVERIYGIVIDSLNGLTTDAIRKPVPYASTCSRCDVALAANAEDSDCPPYPRNRLSGWTPRANLSSGQALELTEPCGWLDCCGDRRRQHSRHAGWAPRSSRGLARQGPRKTVSLLCRRPTSCAVQ
jgi:hypothetical protein